MKSTPLTDKHTALGAKMAEFAGYNMPISYAGIREEHECVRTAVGVFDVSHMGEFIVRGKQALDLVQKVTSNDASKLEIGDVQYSCLPNGQGGIVDDLLVYRLPQDMCAEGEQAFLLVVNASNIDKDWNWISKHNHFDARMINISDETGLLAVQGPKAAEALQPLTDIDLGSMKYYNFAKGKFAGIDNVLVSATGYTGSGGFEIYVNNEDLASLWDAVFAAGANFGIKPIGLGARDTLRLEMGFALYGNDIDDTTSPLEAGLGWITKLNKGDFNDADFLRKQKEAGLSRKLVAFEVLDRRVPRHDYLIEDMDGNTIGKVTSGTQSPSLDKPIGMGYVTTAFAKEGTEIQVVAGGKKLAAKVVKLPFYKG
ncbi:MAG: glycine cleavage system aminomethyltransferase GcvT [Saprospiraceae bacterium]|nr:glycine cleavage system aminomethyltransferase GcvT [Saprospiraceae bacterium]MCF8250273.1 glycine cleavage system aminomethyltransferase GcvT [Saprospiraceae bacterium]MCF8280899.1 glycine cleavage system aminomethyltransferase GcvT [Bacteroidales bacterium]MCF8312095.1 glycine cleavage system aminomethyltransferase GcvT [Saprospiraceae bacterium]MCF8440502.1 glycine cleavage system aminomethyltransferase GcvT [Saprospiraceae bacterium]